MKDCLFLANKSILVFLVPLFVMSLTTDLVAQSPEMVELIPEGEVRHFYDSGGMRPSSFGCSLAISSEDIVIVGGGDCAYVFQASNGTQIHRLTPVDEHEVASFGRSVAIHGRMAFISGARVRLLESPSGRNHRRGIDPVVYVFDIDSGEQHCILAPRRSQAEDELRGSIQVRIAAADGFVVVGIRNFNNSCGAAYLFDSITGEELYAWEASTRYLRFGTSVAVNDRYALIGAIGYVDRGITGTGGAFVFDTSTGDLIRVITPSDGVVGKHFGGFVALNNDGIAVVSGFGCYVPVDGEDIPSDNLLQFIPLNSEQCAVQYTEEYYIYEDAIFLFDIETDDEITRITDNRRIEFHRAGAVAINASDHVLLGNTELSVHGSAVLFDPYGLQQRTFTMPHEAPEDTGSSAFGESVALSEHYAVIGEPGYDRDGDHVGDGIVYVYPLNNGEVE